VEGFEESSSSSPNRSSLVGAHTSQIRCLPAAVVNYIGKEGQEVEAGNDAANIKHQFFNETEQLLEFEKD